MANLNADISKAQRVRLARIAERAATDRVKRERAVRIVRAALQRKLVTVDELTAVRK